MCRLFKGRYLIYTIGLFFLGMGVFTPLEAQAQLGSGVLGTGGANKYAGFSVDLSDDGVRMIFGAPLYSSSTGSYVYEYNTGTSTWGLAKYYKRSTQSPSWT